MTKLLGADALPEEVDLDAIVVTREAVVAAAQASSGLDAKAWNALDETARGALIRVGVEALRNNPAKARQTVGKDAIVRDKDDLAGQPAPDVEAAPIVRKHEPRMSELPGYLPPDKLPPPRRLS